MQTAANSQAPQGIGGATGDVVADEPVLKFGTFLGVFTPSVLTILGLIMYLRFGWVVGNLGLPVTLLVVLMTAVLFSLGGFINAVYAKSFDDTSIVPTFVLTPLTYLGGVFYSISLLPEFWQKVSMANPILYMINAFRYGFLGITDISLWASYGISLAFIAALYGICLWLLRTGKGIRT